MLIPEMWHAPQSMMIRSSKIFLALAALCAGTSQVLPVRADNGKPILIVTGNVNNGNGPVRFSLSSLEMLGVVAVETKTPWHNQKVRFEGVPMSVLMKEVGAKGDVVEAHALNDYSTMIPVEDFRKFNVILATRKNGVPMPVRDNGPLFIIYPYDSDPDLQSQRYYGRSAWQVKELKVK